MKLNKLKNYIKVAKTISENSHDIHTQVGAILVHKTSGAILATGYNGYVRGAPDDALPKTRPEKYDYMLHAEENLMCNSLRHHISTKDCLVINTLSPCKHCLRLLWNAGVDTIYFPEENLYKDFDESLKMGDIDITVERQQDFIKLTLTAKRGNDE